MPGSTTTLVIMGVAGVGKTTEGQRLADRLRWTFAEGDEFHAASNVTKMEAGIPLTDDDRAPWLQSIAAWIGEREARGENAVVTCSALKRRYRDVLRTGHPSVRFVHLAAPAAVVTDRMRTRTGHFMPPVLQASQAAALEPLEPDEPGVVVDATAPPDAVAAAALEGLDLT